MVDGLWGEDARKDISWRRVTGVLSCHKFLLGKGWEGLLSRGELHFWFSLGSC